MSRVMMLRQAMKNIAAKTKNKITAETRKNAINEHREYLNTIWSNVSPMYRNANCFKWTDEEIAKHYGIG